MTYYDSLAERTNKRITPLNQIVNIFIKGNHWTLHQFVDDHVHEPNTDKLKLQILDSIVIVGYFILFNAAFKDNTGKALTAVNLENLLDLFGELYSEYNKYRREFSEPAPVLYNKVDLNTLHSIVIGNKEKIVSAHTKAVGYSLINAKTARNGLEEKYGIDIVRINPKVGSSHLMKNGNAFSSVVEQIEVFLLELSRFKDNLPNTIAIQLNNVDILNTATNMYSRVYQSIEESIAYIFCLASPARKILSKVTGKKENEISPIRINIDLIIRRFDTDKLVIKIIYEDTDKKENNIISNALSTIEFNYDQKTKLLTKSKEKHKIYNREINNRSELLANKNSILYGLTCLLAEYNKVNTVEIRKNITEVINKLK